MGRSFTTVHIHNRDGSTKASFKKSFSDVIKSKGYATSDVDNASLSYTLVFSKDRKWVTVLSEDADARKDAENFSKELKTYAVAVELVDSDFAELSLFDDMGSHIDTLTLGESYLGDDAPLGEPQAWQSLLTDGCTWEKVNTIQKCSYTFAEEALHDFAPLIGMDSENIQLDSDCDTDDMNAVVLHFKHAKEKKLTLNSAFVKYFGEFLLPLGFVKKTINKRPYFIRVINGEILQAVTYRQISARKIGYKTFEIYYDIIPLYRRLVDLTENPGSKLRNMDTFIIRNMSEFDEELIKRAVRYNVDFWQAKRVFSLDYEFKHVGFHFSPEFLTGMEIARDIAKVCLIPRFEGIKTLEQCIEYCYTTSYDDMKSIELDDFDNRVMCYNASLMLIVAGYRKDIYKYIDARAEGLKDRLRTCLHKLKSA